MCVYLHILFQFLQIFALGYIASNFKRIQEVPGADDKADFPGIRNIEQKKPRELARPAFKN
jgi:hypothetical protein